MPMNIGYSGAGSPVLYDMDGDPDGRLEIVMAAGRGVIEVFKADESGVYSVMDGFPVALPADGPIVDGHSSAPAVADLFGDGVPIIVTATTAGKVFAVWPDGNNHDGGPFVPGFPVSADPRPNTSPLAFAHGNSFPSAPTIGDLDGDGTLDIVAASYDQQVYAWSPRDEDESGEADPLPGWPVLARSTADQVDPDKVCDDLLPAQILASPALAILDPDSSDPDFSTYPAVIVGTSEACGSTSRLYAIAHDGYDNADGPFLEGFPVIMPAPLGSVLPIPPLTVGTTSSPAVLTRDDHSLVVSAAFLYAPTIAVVDDGVTDVETAFGAIEGAVSAHPSFGRLAADEEPSLFMPMGAALSVIDGKFALLDFVIDGWNFDAWNDAVFRERLDDMALFQNPTIADLDGDGLNEVIAGSMGVPHARVEPRRRRAGRLAEVYAKRAHRLRRGGRRGCRRAFSKS
ncbi:MAG: hypothetical protein M5R36_24235 [Deltaproteobacteria bacterium]|nr:hypothetical protein [Deltaproteobacteria bacterium]